jgi:hypothetical protein
VAERPARALPAQSLRSDLVDPGEYQRDRQAQRKQGEEESPCPVRQLEYADQHVGELRGRPRR